MIKLQQAFIENPFLFIGLILLVCAVLNYIVHSIRLAYKKHLKAKIILKNGYPPKHCNAFGEAYDETYTNKLRDKYAGLAMQALIQYNHSPEQNGKEVIDIPTICYDAYRYADRMIQEREKEGREGFNG